MRCRIPASFRASRRAAPKQCERILTCPLKRNGWKKFIFEPFEGPFDAGISDGLIATAILGSARGLTCWRLRSRDRELLAQLRSSPNRMVSARPPKPAREPRALPRIVLQPAF